MVAPSEPLPAPSVTAALDVEGSAPLRLIQVDALVVMKIIKHSQSFFPSPVTGQLLGLDVNGVLEVTSSFPFPSAGADGKAATATGGAGGARYQAEMMRCLREVNVDNNTVGWYQSAYLGSFLNSQVVEAQFAYQKTLSEKSVVLVHDVSGGARSMLRAFRLSKGFVQSYKEGKFTEESLARNGVTHRSILEELPLEIKNSHLLTTLLHSAPLDPEAGLSLTAPLTPNLDSVLDLVIDPYLEKNLEFLLEAVDEYQSETSNLQYHQRALAREQSRINTWLSRRRAENLQRSSSGQPPLDEDWKKTGMFKVPQEPSRLEGLLVSAQIEQYCGQVSGRAGGVLGRMYGVREGVGRSEP
ncbi:eukaryotic translation initiation factor 3 subunit H [Saitoella complicata NRRL Y-17804]|uniref:Eukaryotic translation initiation factor 3 subunit H n=1 Tax=Saitoella complicata (strain BCRC 22490 / CBS 7301 / JCM 7358 / NBRC 10748 / NRRL Y-17804) TaxID=698492 RepID=A0A0E9NHV2_SAICN|nr:eukaryotic translation initiation factor 3 subunit H [Saitoella complicata NRRL Y-17804]ODQ53051.1 eukaryotic translation initiation factor 3 subunit H [Saitoella complicata NRRL Y-17804]GAO48985.1 hypothetical protein G7K_3146-t1 [Saitoella complicata NRRL Y-17804]